jgi:tRNA (mo5U34)-methyltransferase
MARPDQAVSAPSRGVPGEAAAGLGGKTGIESRIAMKAHMNAAPGQLSLQAVAEGDCMNLRSLMKTFGGPADPGPQSPDDLTAPRHASMETEELGAESGQGRLILDLLKHEELRRLNDLLPWSCFVLDRQGRVFGKAWSATKRAQPQKIPDHRIVELNRRFPLATRDVLEIGCYEGIHTVALARLARRVMAADSRIENVVKTIVRCALLGERPVVFPWDVEDGLVQEIDVSCDVLHHVGVLYHLVDPVRHLREVLPLVREAVMLDTHVASPAARLDSYVSGSDRFQYQQYKEGGRDVPFAGMADHAKWLLEEDLVQLLRTAGFQSVDVAERRQERNGPRVLIFAGR